MTTETVSAMIQTKRLSYVRTVYNIMAKHVSQSGSKAPTLKDVAGRAGVHFVTASVVLNNAKYGTRVSAETRQRILRAAEEMQYQPSAVSKSFQTRRSNVVGFYSDFKTTALENPFIARVVSSLRDCCSIKGYDLLIHCHNAPETLNKRTAREAFLGSKTLGLIIHSPDESPLMRYLAETYLPVIAINDASKIFPSVVMDDLSGGCIIAEFIHSRSARRILYLDKIFPTSSSTRRRDGFLQKAAELGLIVQLIRVPGGWYDSPELMAYLHDAQNLPCIVVGWNDPSLESVVEACKDLSLRIPEDVSLIGFDGVNPLANYNGVLTTVVASWHKAAPFAVDLLEALTAGQEVPHETLLPVSLRVGDSTI